MKPAWSLALVLIALGPAVVRAKPPPAPEDPPEVEAPFTLSVNHVQHGDVIVVLRGEDVFVDRDDLRAAGLDLDIGEDVQVAGRKLLRLGSVSPPLTYELDEREIALRIFAPAEMLPHTRFDLGARPPDVVYTSDTSAFFNYAPRLYDDGRIELYEETGLSWDGKLLFSSAYLSNTRQPVRGLTNLVLDDRPNLRRYTFGDALVRTGTLGSGGFVGGVTLTRSFELDPYALKAPRIGLAGSTPTPATIDVLVNGTRVRSEEIAPGTFEIDNLQVGSGSGAAGYVIRDVFGNERYVATPYYVSNDALRPGIEEYTYSLGFLRRAVGLMSWDYRRPAVFAHHRRGLDERLTLGGRAEATTERVSAGPSFTALAAFGQFDLDLAGSYDAGGGVGGAARAGYSYASRVFGCSLLAGVSSNRYANVGLAPAHDRATVDAAAILSAPIGTRVTVSYRTSVASGRDSGLTATIGGQTSVRLLRSLNWSTLALRTTHEREPPDWEVMTTLSYAFVGGYSVQSSGRVSDSRESVRLDASKSLPSGPGFGYRASATLAENVSGEGHVQYQSLFGRYGARYAVYADQPQLTLEAAGALVVVPGVGVFPTLPVQSSFGLIRVPGVPGVRGYGNHQELGTTDREGNLIIPNLVSYYGNHFSIAPEDVPMHYEMARTEMVLAPPPRGVAIAEFRVRTPHFYRGQLTVLDAAGARVIPKYGQVRIAQRGEEILSPLGQEGEFELSGLDPGSHQALIEWADGTCGFELTLEDSAETVIELGEVLCEQPANAPAP